MHCGWWMKVGGQAFFADLGLRQSVFLLMRLQTRGFAFYIPLNCALLTEAPHFFSGTRGGHLRAHGASALEPIL